jgi:DNA-binding NarL/FixJ family response regulator
VVKGPVTPDYLTRALEEALRLLDNHRESREKQEEIDDKYDENDPENHHSGSDVRFDASSPLYRYVELELDEEVRILKDNMLAVLTTRHPTRDIDILYGLSVGQKINDLAEALGINVKTVSRRRDDINAACLEWVREYGDQVVGTCLRQIFSEREHSEVTQ